MILRRKEKSNEENQILSMKKMENSNSLYWSYIGVTLELYWSYIRVILELYWSYIGVILELYCCTMKKHLYWSYFYILILELPVSRLLLVSYELYNEKTFFFVFLNFV